MNTHTRIGRDRGTHSAQLHALNGDFYRLLVGCAKLELAVNLLRGRSTGSPKLQHEVIVETP